MVVNRRRVSLGPAEQHQVELPVSLMDEVACVLVLVELGEALPVGRVGLVSEELLGIYYARGESYRSLILNH